MRVYEPSGMSLDIPEDCDESDYLKMYIEFSDMCIVEDDPAMSQLCANAAEFCRLMAA